MCDTDVVLKNLFPGWHVYIVFAVAEKSSPLGSSESHTAVVERHKLFNDIVRNVSVY